MKATILKKEKAQKFYELTGIKGDSIIVYQNRRYYYAIIIDKSFCVRIKKEIANEFI